MRNESKSAAIEHSGETGVGVLHALDGEFRTTGVGVKGGFRLPAQVVSSGVILIESSFEELYENSVAARGTSQLR